ncbi:MAG: transposase, partial [Clostridia bacterium]|nr:transposase [Clostridia bacterium]
PKLGKPFADPEEARRHKKLEWLESGERGEIERHFGVGKRRYSLDCIVTKLKETSEVMIHSIVIYMNLRKRLRLLLRSLFSRLRIVFQNQLKELDFALA